MPIFPLSHKKLVVTCLTVTAVCLLLVATLWPFQLKPKNDVRWLANEDGLDFFAYGTVLSSGQFAEDPGGDHEPFSLELWMEPEIVDDSNVVIAFYTPENPRQFLIRRDLSDISLLHDRPGKKRAKLIAPEVVQVGRRMLVTVTAGPKGTALYIDGQIKQASASYGLSRKNLSGELVIGNSPVGNDTWNGILRGLAIYRQELTAQEVRDHYAKWATDGAAQTLDRSSMLAFYLFRERAGNIVHNEIQPGINLTIPDHYMIWRQNFMLAPWKEFRPDKTYVNDVIVNILGFVPLGLILFPYFAIVRQSKRPWLMSYATGAVLSLTIEILQSFLPMRYSGWTDVITNSTGTALGASVYLLGIGQRVLRKVFGSPAAN
jgi:hypothetical protein